MKRSKGITLIALIITIIILLILAGVAIASLNGENGLFQKVKLAKQKYTIAETKEKLELKITELRIEEEGKGETLTKEDLPKLNSDEIDVGSVENFPVEVIYGKYKFNVDENFIVTYVGEANQTIITYTTEPEGYTNQDEIQILIKVSNPNGIETIEYPDGDILEVDGAKERGIDYKVTANGTYTFKVIDIENNEVIKDIVIDQIDKLKPITATIKEKDVLLESFTIQVTAEDAEEDEKNSKSGIGKCDFYIKSSTDTDYTKYESNNISYNFTELTKGETYLVYATVYDKAGNYIDTTVSEITTLTEPLPPLAKLIFDERIATVEPLEYPIITSDGVMNCEVVPEVGENITLEIISIKPTNETYYYSLDGGITWNEYTAIVNTQYVSKDLIRTKSVYNIDTSITSQENVIKKYKKDLTKECTSSEAMKIQGYDGDWDKEMLLLNKITNRINIDYSAIGLNIKVKFREIDSVRTVNFYQGDGALDFWTPNYLANGIYTYVIKIKPNYRYIRCYTNSYVKDANGNQIFDSLFEIDITDE